MELKNPAHKEAPLNSNSFKTITQDFITTISNSVVFGSTILSLTPSSTSTSTPTPALDLPNPFALKPTRQSYSTDPSPTPSPSPGPSLSQEGSNSMIRYRECQRNHAAHLGSHVVDGCGEFMPAGGDGTPQALRCAACDCHRNFHRRQVDGEPTPGGAIVSLPLPVHQFTATTTATATATLINNSNATAMPVANCYISFGKPHKMAPVANHRSNTIQQCSNNNNNINSGRHSTPMMMAFGSGGAAAESSSEDLNAYQAAGLEGQLMMEQYGSSKKRFRTKFTQEQKDKMMEFSDRIGWRIQKQDEAEVQQLCGELGIKRQVFKVWMHNNKQAIKRKQS